MKARAARIWPPWVPVRVQDVKKLRRSSGACSSVSELAPACSPAADRPCSSRQSTSSAGAAQPIWSKVGIRPMAKVAEPIHQHLLPADPVTVVTEDDRADRAGDVRDPEGGERHHQRRGVGG